MSVNPSGCFAGKAVVVTGSSSGIGLEIVRHFGAAGADVVVNGRSLEGVSDAAREIEALGVKAVTVAADVSTPRPGPPS